MKTLFFVPRYREQTLHHPVQAKYGQVKVIAYPRSSGTGMVASHLMRSICVLAGLRDVGVKVRSLQGCTGVLGGDLAFSLSGWQAPASVSSLLHEV